MKTKRNTKYSRESVSAVLQDIFVVLFSLSVIGYTAFLFFNNLNKTIERTDKVPVASISYKYKSVQRKFLDRSVWDRPVQYSPVYNGDIIRTAPASEATIYFPDQNVINVGANTMIQIFKPTQKDETDVQIAEGNVSVQTVGSKVAVKADNVSVAVEKDSVLHVQKFESAEKEAGSVLSSPDASAAAAGIAGDTARKSTAQGENAAPGGALRLTVEKGAAAMTTLEGGSTDVRAGRNVAAIAAEPTVLSEGAVVQTGNNAAVSMIRPASGARLINQYKRLLPVSFAWSSSFSDDTELVLETSRSRDFAKASRLSVKGLQEVTLDEEAGTVYWRIYAAERGARDESADSGKFTVVDAPPPVPLEPVPDRRFVYKETMPTVRFLWKGNDVSSSYMLETADNPDMRNPAVVKQVSGETVTLPNLREGVWYWRVTPNYIIDESIRPKPSVVSAFSIEKQKELPPIKLIAPGAIADTAEGKSVAFSWKRVNEASKYRLVVAKSESMSDTVVERTSDINYYELKNAAKALPNGIYYWTVEGLDKNGEHLTASAPSAFRSRDSEVVLRSLFPPDNYVLADTLCLDTRFTWKTNLEGEQRFQVSASPDFSNPVLDVKALGSGIDGTVLPQGDYFWRVSVKSEFEALETPPKRLTVAPALPSPKLVGIGEVVVIHPQKKNTFAWTAVPGADYYQVKITKPGLDSEPLYENLYITDTGVEIALQSIQDGDYIMSVQGFASSTLTSSRRYSYAADKAFMLKHLRPVELVSPANNARIGGVDAALNPVRLQWSSVEKPVKSRLVLEKAGQRGSVLSVSDPSFSVKLPSLTAGNYRWRVIASTADGFDISSMKDSSFTVLPIPPLERVALVFPSDGETFGVSFFKANRSIVFRWKKNGEATHYVIRLYNEKKQKIFERELSAETSSRADGDCAFEFGDLERLSRGIFYAEVEPERRLKDGMLFQSGIVSSRRFVIDLPKAASVETDAPGVLYGK
ncbi:FecR family protein [Treponema sp. Marseille-Q4130]|uniref:FecR family protein n=1 Tax=Treponema sp. Marseille-Q4130 TaxID=2766702 RepID=UPI0016520EFF|nr:FecR family protein [Treponema sp. Marseille-Q4130]MBC6719018.1 FecR domain-containing protein [Treponema sp. Marseille-Q4130]